jgi:hypothetical protein
VAIEILEIDPRNLHLPSSRRDGADPWKLQQQIAKRGKDMQGMPPIAAARGKNGELMIVDGVTRATRVAKLLPGEAVPVEIVEDAPRRDFSRLPTVGERLP